MTKTMHWIGVDLGGTNMRAGVVDGAGRLLHKEGCLTCAQNSSGEEILRRLSDLMLRALEGAGVKKASVAGAGIGIPGPLDPAIGGAHPPNIPQLSGFPIARLLETATEIPVFLENDANAAAWGEYWAGAGRGCRSMVQATLGTGVGGGLIIEGTLVRGIDWTAGELGHVVVIDGGRPCACGRRGCIEAYASADSTVRRFREALAAGRPSALASSPPGALTCAAIFDAARAEDALALETVRETGRLLGVLAANVANLLNPERFILSGGMIRAGELLFDAVRAECVRSAFALPGRRMQILPAALGDDAGLIGAAGCARTTFETSRS